jgi:hypothetical protein
MTSIMDKVYTFLIAKILAPLTGLGDDDAAVARFQTLDLTKEDDVKTMIRSVLLPHFAGLKKKRGRTQLCSA